MSVLEVMVKQPGMDWKPSVPESYLAGMPTVLPLWQWYFFHSRLTLYSGYIGSRGRRTGIRKECFNLKTKMLLRKYLFLKLSASQNLAYVSVVQLGCALRSLACGHNGRWGGS